MKSKNYLITIVGPTGVGKTVLAIEIAKFFKTEIISSDSRQFFKEMEIGTAKPSASELSEIKHHFINNLSIEDNYSVGNFEKETIDKLNLLFTAHPIIVMVGGSGLYIDAVINGLDKFPEVNKEIRDDLNEKFNELGIGYLQDQLKLHDPIYYQEVDLQNPQRIIRALEVCLSSRKPFSSFRNNKINTRNFHVIKIGLTTSREVLYKRINHRVDEMIKNGLIEEARNLYPKRNLNALQTVGYSELFNYFDNIISLQEATDQIKQNTRRFAKRQLTWFRKDQGITWFEPNDKQEILSFIKNSLETSK